MIPMKQELLSSLPERQQNVLDSHEKKSTDKMASQHVQYVMVDSQYFVTSTSWSYDDETLQQKKQAISPNMQVK